MRPFTYERAADAAGGGQGRRRDAQRQVPRRRHQPARPDEAGDRDPGPPDRRRPPAAGRRSRTRRTAACASAPWPPTATWPPTRRVRARYPVLTQAHRRRRLAASCATRPPPAATCCSAPAAPTSTTPPSPAISAQPGSGCGALEGLNRNSRDLRRQPRLHRHPSLGHGRGAGGAGRQGRDPVAVRRGARSFPIDRAAPPARRDARRWRPT